VSESLPEVADVVQESATLFASLAFARLSEETRDLEEARGAIEALKVLIELVAEDRRADFRSVLANLQIAYADAAAR
jgi:hypothetical protein